MLERVTRIIVALFVITSACCAQDSLEISLLSRSLVNWSSPGYTNESHLMRVVLYGYYAIVKVGGRGIWIMDVSDPAFPQPVWYDDVRYRDVSKIGIQGNLLFLIQWSNSLSILDISDPRQPVELCTIEPEQGVFDMAFDGNILLTDLTDARGFDVFSITDPTEPRVIGHFDSTGYSLVVRDSFAYELMSRNSGPRVREYGVRIISLADPTHPVEISLLPIPNGGQSIQIVDDQLYVISNNLLTIYSLADPARPVELGSGQLRGNIAQTCVEDEHLFLADLDGDLFIYDLHDPANIDQVGSYEPRNQWWGDALDVRGNLVAMVADDKLKLVDVSDRSRPILSGVYDGNGNLCDMVVDGRFGYIERDGGIEILDLTNPQNPEELSSLPYDYDYSDFVVDGTRLYLFNHNAERQLVTYDVSDRRRPVINSESDVSPEPDQNGQIEWNPCRMAIDKVRHYVILLTSNPSGFVVYNDDSREWMFQIARYNLENDSIGWPSLITMLDNSSTLLIGCNDRVFVYDLADLQQIHQVAQLSFHIVDFGLVPTFSQSNGLVAISDSKGSAVFDLRDPAHPIALDIFGRSIVQRNNLVIGTTGYEEGLICWDIADIHNPRQIGITQFPGYANSVQIVGDVLYITTNSSLIAAGLPPLDVPVVTPLSPSSLHLSSYPNPFNSSTTISYALPTSGCYALTVTDITGREVARLSGGWKEAGSYHQVWDGGMVASGSYLICLKTQASKVESKVSLIR